MGTREMGLQTRQAWLGDKTPRKGPERLQRVWGSLRDGETRQNPSSHCVENGLMERQSSKWVKCDVVVDQHRGSRRAGVGRRDGWDVGPGGGRTGMAPRSWLQ